MQKKANILKSHQTNHFGRYLKLLKSFDIEEQFKRKRSLPIIESNVQNNNNPSLSNLMPKKIPIPKTTTMHKTKPVNQETIFVKKLQQNSFRSRSTDMESGLSNNSKLKLFKSKAKQNLKTIQKDKNDSKSYSFKHPTVKNNMRIKTQARPSIQSLFPKIVFKRLRGATSGNLLQFSRLKPTQQYFSTLQNVKLAQRLLLAQPSKDIKRQSHKKFYNQQKTFRNQISQSFILKNKMKNMPLVQMKKMKKHKRTKTQWIE